MKLEEFEQRFKEVKQLNADRENQVGDVDPPVVVEQIGDFKVRQVIEVYWRDGAICIMCKA